MNRPARLTSLQRVAGAAFLPAYSPSEHGHGIVHLGVGAFYKAHGAAYTDTALAEAGGDWRVVGVSLRGTAAADALNSQTGLYTLVERGPGGERGRIIAAIDRVIAATRDRAGVLDVLSDPGTRIVSLTVTEKAYGIDRRAGTVDPSHAAIAGDLNDPRAPIGAVGLIVEGLRRRRAAGLRPFTVLCCDNLPDNGGLLRTGVLDFAGRIDPDLQGWIADEGRFPATMVDRITPSSTDATLAAAEELTGCRDLAAVETEPFTQWVIEDRFADGRPAWETGGALFVENVAPFERMKLRMLNGAHSMLAYAGFLSGFAYVRDVMADGPLATLVARHMTAAAATLEPLTGIDLEDYAAELADRFRNPAIAHETYQIAMDGTEKLPQRLLEPAVHALDHGQDIRPFAFAVAAWMRYALGRRDDGSTYALRDPREAAIAAAVSGAGGAEALSGALHGLVGLFPAKLTENPQWRAAVEAALGRMLDEGMAAAVAAETRIP